MIGVSTKGKLSLLNTPQHHCSRATAQTLSLADFIGDNALIANKGNIADKELDKGHIADKIGNSATTDVINLVVCMLLFSCVPESTSEGRGNLCC
jgi:hypothetical protein